MIIDPNHLKQSGSVLGAILLIAGSCIGAGMLGLPVLTALAGFQPSLLLLLLSWMFMAITGLLLLEVNLWFREEVSLISMSQRSLGAVGGWVSWSTFLFLFYSLLVAYETASGGLCTDFVHVTTGVTIPYWTGSFVFTVLFGWLIYLGTEAVDRFNRLLMVGLIGAYLMLMLMGTPHIKTAHLHHSDWYAALFILPPMVLSFGYHNLIPSLTTYLGHNRRRLIISIFAGSFVPLLVYILWEWLVLGIVPIQEPGGFLQALDEGSVATHALKNVVGSAWVVTAAQLFAFFAIVTSFLSVALSFLDFLADGLSIEKTQKGRLLLCGLTLAPPFTLAILYPKVFLIALNYAGAFGAVILFGILPALMVWKGRYGKERRQQRIMPGGRPLLLLIIGFALAVIVLQLSQELGWTKVSL